MLKIYICNRLPEETENKQFEVLIDYMYRYFDSHNEDTYLVINPTFPGVSKQFDLLVYRNHKFALIEMKNIHGGFYPNLEYWKPWEYINRKGERIPFDSQRENPFNQVSKQKSSFVEFLVKNFPDAIRRISKFNIDKAARRLISPFIVTAEDSYPIYYDERATWCCTLKPISVDLMRRLAIVSTHELDGFPLSDFKKILKMINATMTTKDDWPFNGVLPEYKTSRIPKIDRLLASNEEASLLKGLEYCKDLSLITYYDKILKFSTSLNKKIKRFSYNILFEWLSDFQKTLGINNAEECLIHAIADDDGRIREDALNFVNSNSYSYSEELHQVLIKAFSKERDFSLIALFIKSMQYFNDHQSSEIMLTKYYKNEISNFLFDNYIAQSEISKEFDLLYDGNILPTPKNEEQKKKIEKYRESVVQVKRWTEVTKAWINTIVAIGSKDLKVLIHEHLRSLLLLYKTYGLKDWPLPPTMIETLDAVEGLRPDAASEILMNALREVSDYPSCNFLAFYLIDTLGSLGEKEAAKLIRPYLRFHSKNGEFNEMAMRWMAASALSSLGLKEYFDGIWNMFLNELDIDTPYSCRSKLETIISLDKMKVESRLLDLLRRSNFDEASFNKYGKYLMQAGGERTFDEFSKLLIDKGMFMEDDVAGPSNIMSYIAWSQDDMKEKAIKTGKGFLQLNRDDLIGIGIELAEPYFLDHINELAKYEDSGNYKVLSRVIHIYDLARCYDKVEKFVTNPDVSVGELAFIILQRAEGYTLFEDMYVHKNGSSELVELVVGNQALYIGLTRRYSQSGESEQYYERIDQNYIRLIKTVRIRNIPIGLFVKTGSQEHFFYPHDLMTVNSILFNDYSAGEEIIKLKDQLHVDLKKDDKDAEIPKSEDILKMIRLIVLKEESSNSFSTVGENIKQKMDRLHQYLQANMISLQ